MAPRLELWLENLADERDGAALYERLAALEKDPVRAESFRQLSFGERRHAELWAKKLAAAGAEVPPDRPSMRVRLLLLLARRFGVPAVLPLVLETEVGDVAKYVRQGSEAAALAKDEEQHRDVLIGMRHGAADARTLIASREAWHRAGRGGAIRAAIFGVNDGVISNCALVLGVAGAGVGEAGLVITGLAGLLAGAFSMAVGEYSSVASQRDLLSRQISLEKRELEEAPEEEAAELAQLLRQKGLSPEQAERTAADILKNPEQALDTLVREELGLDPADLGSPSGAAASSFATFAAGALVPIAPFLLGGGRWALLASPLLSALVLFGVGGLVGLLSGTSPWKSAARMVGLAALATAFTYALGRLFGAAIDG
ncbi:MAG: VIT1/CCC1 transporter family protein [Myxococcales bacterium]|nr:VIT1/CCC1 transporter family protein [Myxococcales bacterium]